RYSRIASESHTISRPSIRIGTLPAWQYSRMRARVSGWRSGMMISLNESLASRIATQGRKDQLDHFLVPMMRVRLILSLLSRFIRVAGPPGGLQPPKQDDTQRPFRWKTPLSAGA